VRHQSDYIHLKRIYLKRGDMMEPWIKLIREEHNVKERGI
jgi:hypothetical protein